jgi:hypothetical protein
MAKRVPAPKKPEAGASQQLINAIVTVKNLQGFIKHHGTSEQAIKAVDRVLKLVELTGSFDQLKQALEIVGKEEVAEEKEETAPAAE